MEHPKSSMLQTQKERTIIANGGIVDLEARPNHLYLQHAYDDNDDDDDDDLKSYPNKSAIGMEQQQQGWRKTVCLSIALVLVLALLAGLIGKMLGAFVFGGVE